jgi:hypothetical protein
MQLTSDIKLAATAFDQFMTGVSPKADMVAGNFDGRL